MNHDHESHRASAPAAPAARNDTIEPGQSSRSALLRRPGQAVASGLVQRKETEARPRDKDVRSEGAAVHELASEGISGPATALPFLGQIQRSFGAHDVSNIQAHIGGPATQACRSMGARAYARGNHVAFRESPDLHLAAHEAAHVVQQRAGVRVSGGIGQAGDDYERNADQVADAVVAGRSAEALLGGEARPNHSVEHGGRPVQAQREAASIDSGSCSKCQAGDCECSESSGSPEGPSNGAPGQAVQRSIGAEIPAIQLAQDELQPPSSAQDSQPCDEFCKAFPSKALAIASRDTPIAPLYQSLWSVLKLGIAAHVSRKVLPLWDEWAHGGGPRRDITPTFGVDFTNSPTTLTTALFLRSEIAKVVAKDTGPLPGMSVKVPLSDLIWHALVAINTERGRNRMNFDHTSDIPGNLAGDLGKDQAATPTGATPSLQNDGRFALGDVTITGMPSGARKVTPSITFAVVETLDLCPGNCGAPLEQIATVPMSRWEASGIAGDVPYFVMFAPPPAFAAPFEVPAPAHMVPPTPATPSSSMQPAPSATGPAQSHEYKG